jgi:hypothetical protein
VILSPVAATATPVPSATEQQQDYDDDQNQFHGKPPFRMMRGDAAAQRRAVTYLTDGLKSTRGEPNRSNIV